MLPWRLIVIGNPDSQRVKDHASVANARSVQWMCIPWIDVLSDKVPWKNLAGHCPSWLRIESPGKSWPVEKALLSLGVDEADEESNSNGALWKRLSKADVDALAPEPGRVLPQRQWWLGWRRALRQITDRLRECGAELFLTAPVEDLWNLFDKEACQRRLEEAGVPCPVAHPAMADEATDILEWMEQSWPRIYLKACHSSSASCVAAMEYQHGQVQAFSSVEWVEHAGETRIYNSRKLHRYTTTADVIQLGQAIGAQRAYAQKWFPKAGWQGLRMDFRVVVIAGKARHVVPRLSASPMTNLQLGGRRGDVSELRRHMGEPAWNQLVSTAEQAAAVYPECLQISLDIAVDSSFRRFVVLEANAFGDFLPGCLWEGRSTYEWELDAMESEMRSRYRSPKTDSSASDFR